MSQLLKTTTTVEAIVNLLIDRIKNGIYSPGKKLPSERRLQDECGVGRLALREALSRLNAMGIITTAHGRGTFVESGLKSDTFKNLLIPHFALSDPKRLQDFVVARSMIESEIAGLAATERTEEDLKKLWQVLEHPLSDTVSLAQAAQLDFEFHRILADSINNRFLTIMHEALTDQIRLFLLEFVKSKENAREVLDAHIPIIQAIERQDSGAARELARQHISYSARDYEKYINMAEGRKK